jgi:hypothetical protein
MAVMSNSTKAHIFYFESEGRDNLDEVVKVIKKNLRNRQDLRDLKIVIFTSQGRGPVLAYNGLGEFFPKIIAVTFPLGFTVRDSNGNPYCPRISDHIDKFFKGVEIDVVVPPRLPFDLIDSLEGHNQQMQLIRKTMAMFGTGFELCFQALLCACDAGHIEEGEQVIVFSGDTAGLFVASSTRHFLNPNRGAYVQEIFCKPRRLNISRPSVKPPTALTMSSPKTLEGERA